MKRILFFGLLLFACSNANAQLPQIQITAVFPAGAQQGSSVDVAITAGSNMDEAAELVFSHPGLSATAKLDAKGEPIANQFVVSVSADTQPGLYDVRLKGLFGISNPRIFRVDTLPEIQEAEPNNTPAQAQTVAINSIVNARSNGAADVDVFHINVAANQSIAIRSEAAILDSVMQPTLELFDAAGRRVAQARRITQHDAVIVYENPIDQTLSLKVHDVVYAGSSDYTYRLSIDTRPVVDFVVPPVVQSAVDSQVTVFGRNMADAVPTDLTIDGVPLQKKQITLKVADTNHGSVGTDSASTSINAVTYSGIDGNLLSLSVQNLPVSFVTESSEQSAFQTIEVPTTVSGTFAKELDEDTYRFTAKKGEQWQIEVLAQRLNSSADPILVVEQVLTAADGTETLKRLAREDDNKQNPGGAILPTLTSDPSFVLNVPEDGQYQVRIKDKFSASRGAANLTYSIAIEPAAADFQLVVFDSQSSIDGKAPPTAGAISLRKGGTYELPVYAYRISGHNDNIKLLVEGLPEGITVSETSIRPGSSSAVMVFHATNTANEVAVPVRIFGTVETDGSPTKRAAAVATLTHTGVNGLPRTARVCSSMLLCVMKDAEPFYVEPEFVNAEITQDQQLLVPISITRSAGFDGKVDIAFSGQPGNVDVPKVAFEKDQTSAIARFYFKDNAPPGPATLLLHATATVPYIRNPWQVERAKLAVAKAVEKLAAEQNVLATAKAAGEAGEKKVTELATAFTAYEQELVAAKSEHAKVKEELKLAIGDKTKAASQLASLQAQLTAASAAQTTDNADLDAAIKSVREATDSVNEASKPVAALIEKINAFNHQIETKETLVTEKTAQIARAKTEMTAQQQAVEKAKAAVIAAEAALKAAEAAKLAAEESTKKAEEAAKPKNINVRSVTRPIQLSVHTTPGKIAAAVPNAGAIKKGASADVKVTLTRKNNFAGPVSVRLQLPESEKRISSTTVEIAADQTEATLTLTADANAAPADIANAVIQATAEFGGRKASFDVPVSLKVVD